MCGIFGGIGIKNFQVLKNMSRSILYRGPDKFNYFEDKKLFLGNNRLSIIDRKKGKQPFYSEDQNFVIVFNGTIFNFQEIKRYLEKKKISFKSNSDTEVLVNSFMYWKEECFKFFDGMWAAAIYDRKKKYLTLSRDYIGQKPLYYYNEKEKFIFASEIKSIFRNDIKKQINLKSLKEYFIYSHVPEPKTIFSNIYQVEPGQNLTLNCKNLDLKKRKYWDISNGPNYNKFFEKKNSDLEKIIRNKLDYFTISDYKPCFFVSSGIDSNLILKIIDKKKKLNKYNLSFDSKTFDESKTLRKYKIKNTNYYKLSKKKVEDNFFSLSKFLDEPLGDSSILPTYSLFKHAKKKKEKLVIGGDGGDESFFGYIIFDALYIALIIKKIFPKFVLNFLKKLTSYLKESRKYMDFSFKIKKFFNGLNQNLLNLPDIWMSSLDENEFNDYFSSKKKNYIESFFRKKENLKKNNFMKNMQIYFFKYYLSNVLKKVDRGSMYNSIEYRAPLLSKNIINYGINNNNKFRFLKKKYNLRKVSKELLDKKILSNEKHGFALPRELIIENKRIIKGIKKKYLYNPRFFYDNLENYYKKKYFNSAYLWNEIILNYTLQNIYEKN